jgi:hypothetical protein
MGSYRTIRSKIKYVIPKEVIEETPIVTLEFDNTFVCKFSFFLGVL